MFSLRRLEGLSRMAVQGSGGEAKNATRILRRKGLSRDAMHVIAGRGSSSGLQYGAKAMKAIGPAGPIQAAKNGKNISKMVAGAVVGAAAIQSMRNRSGRAADRVVGRPTGMYGY